MPVDAAPPFPVDLVLVGGDIGVYALARAFHEEYGTIASVIARKVAGPVADSVILEAREVGMDASEEQLVAEMIRVGEEKRGQRGVDADPAGRPILLANADFLVALIAANRDRLDPLFHLPILADETLAAVSDKAEFTRLCIEADVPVPRTVVLDFRDGTAPDVPELDLGWPLVAKAARSSAYSTVTFPGKRKVFEMNSREEILDLVDRLVEAGFRDRFVLQEMIPGDDTAMRSVTAYVDSRGEVTLLGGARVLLEEHTPTALGNPAAMFTTDLGDVFDQSVRLLQRTGYRGFANFDVKVDPRDGVAKFFEVNPRIGRNNQYMTSAGANVARPVVADMVESRAIEQIRPNREILYSIVPRALLWRYIVDPALRARVKAIARRGTVHPLLYRPEGWRRRAYVVAAMANQVKKFAQYYRRPSYDGF